MNAARVHRADDGGESALDVFFATAGLRERANAAVLGNYPDDDFDDYANGCGVCGCCPCREPGCDECPPSIQRAPDTGAFGYHAPLVHGIRRARALVTYSLTRGRGRFGSARDIPDLKRRTHRKHRRAWRMWCADPSQPEPSIRSLTSWEVW